MCSDMFPKQIQLLGTMKMLIWLTVADETETTMMQSGVWWQPVALGMVHSWSAINATVYMDPWLLQKMLQKWWNQFPYRWGRPQFGVLTAISRYTFGNVTSGFCVLGLGMRIFSTFGILFCTTDQLPVDAALDINPMELPISALFYLQVSVASNPFLHDRVDPVAWFWNGFMF